jgi:RNA polymerase sigma-70 factor (ECF subfamily)
MDASAVTRALAGGDVEAFDILHEHCRPRLWRFLLSLCRGREHQAEDVLQETMMRVIRYARPLPSEQALWNWLFRLARSAHVDSLRRERRHAEKRRDVLALDPAAPEPEEVDADLLAHLDAALAGLDPVERSIVEGRHLLRRPTVELAAELGLTPKAVESRLARARTKLREVMKRRIARDEP